MELARTIASGPPLAYTHLRRMLQRSIDTGRFDFLEMEWRGQAELLRTADAREGFRSFIEQREPEFSGE